MVSPSARAAMSLHVAPPRARLAALVSLRMLIGLTASAAALAGAYLVARETPAFAVREVAVRGAPAGVAADVRRALASVRGESLVTVDAAALERRLHGIPSIADAHVDREFPHALLVVVRPERPLAVVRRGGRAWLVAESGRVVRAVAPAALPALPRLRGVLERPPSVGETLSGPPAATGLAVLRAAPPAFRQRVLSVSIEAGEATLVLRDGPGVVLGPATDVEAKFASAAAVLASIGAEGAAVLAYLDVSVPTRVVAGANTQPWRKG
ncbi:MAG: FtsQ-type POTRA domain-containing protein [Thermoleophilia bacterium]|nr:FtsQ-type POTRA domain-containing protein [Thermoleophilia bacterium]